MLKWTRLIVITGVLLRATPPQGSQEYVITPTPLQARYLKMRSAFEDWRVGDPYVERDVFKADPTKVISRIDNAEKRMVLFLEARRQYYVALAESLERDSAKVSRLADEHDESHLREARNSASEQSALLGARMDDLERAISELEKQQGQLEAARRLQEERENLSNIRDSVRKEVDVLDAMMEQGSKARDLRAKLRQNHELLRESLRHDAAAAEADQELWKRYYEGLRAVAETRKKSSKSKTAPGASVPGADTKGKTQAKPPARTDGSIPPQMQND